MWRTRSRGGIQEGMRCYVVGACDGGSVALPTSPVCGGEGEFYWAGLGWSLMPEPFVYTHSSGQNFGAHDMGRGGATFVVGARMCL